MSRLPLATAWMAVSKLAPQPVAFYAAVFLRVNATYICLIWELIDRAGVAEISPGEPCRGALSTAALLFGALSPLAGSAFFAFSTRHWLNRGRL
jgi:hypothetical protein